MASRTANSVAQFGNTVCARYHWPDEPASWVYDTLTDAEVNELTADQLREAMGHSGGAVIMRAADTGTLCVFQAAEMEVA